MTRSSTSDFIIASALVALAAMRLEASPSIPIPQLFFTNVSESELRQQYPDRPDSSNNVREVEKYLSSDSPYSMRLSTSTENSISRQLAAQGNSTNLHSHINFGSNQFLVEELDCPPNSYPLDVWQPVNNKAKIRSDGFFDGKYFIMMPGGILSEMEFGDLSAFKKACIAAMQITGRPSTHNSVLEGGCVDFRQFARFQNLGHDGVIPNSYVFSNTHFVCLGVRGDRISGSISTNAAGLVDIISYASSEHYGPRIFFLRYETKFADCPWYPSRIVDATKRGIDRYDVRAIHTVHNVYAEEGAALRIPTTTAELYATNPTRLFEWSNSMAYEFIGTQQVARPTLVQPQLGVSPRGRTLFGVFFAGSSLILLIAIIYFFQLKPKQTKGNHT